MQDRADRAIEKYGKLKKYSPSIFFGWQDRYVKVEDRQLKWFKKAELQGIINFDLYGCTVEKIANKPREFAITVEGIERKFEF